MTLIYGELLKARFEHLSTSEVAVALGITAQAASRLVRHGKLPGVKIGGVYMVPRDAMKEFARGYVPRKGRPRKKRKYTRKSPIVDEG